MSLWLLLAAHLIADFSLQPADWAEKKTQRFKYLARHAFVYAIVIAAVVFLCIPWESARIPFVIIALSHFFIDRIRVYVYREPFSILILQSYMVLSVSLDWTSRQETGSQISL